MRDCENCKHHILNDYKNMTYGCESWECKFEPKEQEPKTGHWILDDSDNSVICDKCGCTLYPNDILHGEAHFCPNCGADMRADRSEEE